MIVNKRIKIVNKDADEYDVIQTDNNLVIIYLTEK